MPRKPPAPETSCYELPIAPRKVLRGFDLVAWNRDHHGRVQRYTASSAGRGPGRARYPRDPIPSQYLGVCLQGGTGPLRGLGHHDATALVATAGYVNARCVPGLEVCDYIRPSPKGFVNCRFRQAVGLVLKPGSQGVNIVWLFPPSPWARRPRRRKVSR